MTRVFVFGALLLFMAVTFVIASDNTREFYSDKYDDINIEEILYNPRQRKQYSMCYLGTAPCITPAAKFFKETFSDALLTKCNRCTGKQKEILNKVVDFYINKEPMVWSMILRNILRGKETQTKTN